MNSRSILNEIVNTTVFVTGTAVGATATLASAVIGLPLLYVVLYRTSDRRVQYKETGLEVYTPPYERF